MKIHVEMTSDEFRDFLSWRADKQMYDRDVKECDAKIEHISNKILWALELDEKKPGKAKIIDHDHAVELVDMANDWFA